jgi:hemoglobin
MVNYKITSAVMGERPKFELPNKGFLETLKPAGFTEMINHFYAEVLESDIAHYFPDDLEELELIKKRNGAYFMMLCGGDDRYISKFGGDFDQIKTHKPFSIPDKARTEWLGCWEIVLTKIEDKVDHDDIQSYWNWLEVFSKHIVNYENDRETREDKAKVH